MADPYQQIPEDKQDKIFQAAIREFAERGYEKASTNQIIQEAQISKGLLFHYFKSKKNLFLATFDRSVGETIEEVLPQLKDPPADFFERMGFMGQFKIRFYMERPVLYRFYMSSVADMQNLFPEELAKRNEELKVIALPMMVDNIDRSKFRPELDPERVVRLIYAGLESLRAPWIQRILQQPDKGLLYLEEAIKEYEEMLEIFKYGVYRP